MKAPRQIWRKIVDAFFPAGRRAEALYASAAAQARMPAFYAGLMVPDTPEGRFEMVALHVILLLDRLMQMAAMERERNADRRARDLARELQERMFDDLDASLREMGVSDVAVPGRMRKLGVAFYERMQKCHLALANDDVDALKQLFTRHIYALTQFSVLTGRELKGAPVPENESRMEENARRLADYALRARNALKDTTLNDLWAGRVPWPVPEETS